MDQQTVDHAQTASQDSTHQPPPPRKQDHDAPLKAFVHANWQGILSGEINGVPKQFRGIDPKSGMTRASYPAKQMARRMANHLSRLQEQAVAV